MFHNLGGPSFEDFFITARQYIYVLLCVIIASDTGRGKSSDFVSSGLGRTISDASTTDALKYMLISINFLHL